MQFTCTYIQCNFYLEWCQNCMAYISRSYRHAINIRVIFTIFLEQALFLTLGEFPYSAVGLHKFSGRTSRKMGTFYECMLLYGEVAGFTLRRG